MTTITVITKFDSFTKKIIKNHKKIRIRIDNRIESNWLASNQHPLMDRVHNVGNSGNSGNSGSFLPARTHPLLIAKWSQTFRHLTDPSLGDPSGQLQLPPPAPLAPPLTHAKPRPSNRHRGSPRFSFIDGLPSFFPCFLTK